MTSFEKAFVAHLIADWVLQNDWMARHKTSLRHPAAWVHAGIHGVCLGLALGWPGGVVLGFAHLLIDTRVPVAWWIQHFKRSQQAPESATIAIWLDQTFHIACIAAWVALN